MYYRVRYFFVVLLLLVVVVAQIWHNEGLYRVSRHALEVVCGGTSDPVCLTIQSWLRLPIRETSQQTGEPSRDISTHSSSGHSDISDRKEALSQDPYFGSSNSSAAVPLIFICSSTSTSPSTLWRSGGMRSSRVEMNDICALELEQKLCILEGTELLAMRPSTPQSLNKRKYRQISSI